MDTADVLHRLAAEGSGARQGRRLLSLAASADGMSRGDAACIGGICPERGPGAAIMMPAAATCAMQRHPEEISKIVSNRAPAVIIMDQAGGHMTSAEKSRKTCRSCFCRPNHRR